MVNIDGYSMTRSFISGVFTIGAAKAFEIQHQCQDTTITFGFGLASGYGVLEIYCDVQLWKVA